MGLTAIWSTDKPFITLIFPVVLHASVIRAPARSLDPAKNTRPLNHLLWLLRLGHRGSDLLCILFLDGSSRSAARSRISWDFTMLNGMLFVLLFVLIIYGILLLFIRSYWLHLLYAGLGTIIFSLYLVMDVQLMVGGRHHHSDLHPEEYIFAALNIYLDIINLFLFILQLIGLGR
ncbi:protein lifeguard 2-like [Halichoerus grypus]